MKADFLTSLIERNRDSMPQERRVQPLIATLYAAEIISAPPDNAIDESLILEPEHPIQTPAPFIAESTPVRQSEENISIAPPLQRGELPEIKPARATAEKTQNSRFDQTPGIEPLPQTAKTPKSTLSQFTLPQAQPVNARPGLTDPAEPSLSVNQESLVIRPRIVRADESGSATTNRGTIEAANQIANRFIGDQAEPVISVTIGRIDVRAVVQPSTPPRRTTPSTPKLSLEDYLRSRSGEKR